MQLCLSTAFFCFSVVIDSKTNTILYPPFATEALITSCTSNLTTCLNTTSTIWKSTMIETMMGPTSTTWNYTTRRADPCRFSTTGSPVVSVTTAGTTKMATSLAERWAVCTVSFTTTTATGSRRTRLTSCQDGDVACREMGFLHGQFYNHYSD